MSLESATWRSSHALTLVATAASTTPPGAPGASHESYAVWVVLIVAAALVVVVYFLRHRIRQLTVRWGGGIARIQAFRKDPKLGGALVEDVKAGGSVQAIDKFGGGAAVRRADAGGDISASSAPKGRSK